jgi:hypothetical protein
MDNFNLQKFLVENKMTRNSKLLNEIKIIPSVIGSSLIPTPQEWESLGEGYEVEEYEDNNTLFITPSGLTFAEEPNEPKALSAEIQYWDYEMDEEEGSEMAEGIIDELKKVLQPRGYKVEGVFSSSDCMIYIYR